ncbi:hypothetical protein [Pseudomarimonas salicorniae]|uniref:Uncharacterized protein n=1 Tax=Pseudomarimonas salicorniae TaxID=2933270 RepID=A0ABT0GM89_9GAMM|nr:hypothetical protein [Lysobacter sp. CAU 1642]MCK7595630.1 hypothetical protein [Lysobacter sp. CAU 1642]
MPTYRKVHLAALMLLEADTRFSQGRSDEDFLAAIVLSGAVLGIVSPLLKEHGGHSYHSILAEISGILHPEKEGPVHEGVFRTVYNGLKHAGDNRRSLKPSEDLLIEAELRLEAARMLEAATHDFREVPLHEVDRESLPSAFLELLREHKDYT